MTWPIYKWVERKQWLVAVNTQSAMRFPKISFTILISSDQQKCIQILDSFKVVWETCFNSSMPKHQRAQRCCIHHHHYHRWAIWSYLTQSSYLIQWWSLSRPSHTGCVEQCSTEISLRTNMLSMKKMHNYEVLNQTKCPSSPVCHHCLAMNRWLNARLQYFRC